MPCKWYERCPVKRHVEQGIADPRWVDDYCLREGGFKECVRYKKEERGEYHPDAMLPDGSFIEP